jgi:hypothetical protein
MPRLKAKNLARTALASSISATATTCTVVDASKLPDVPFRAVIGGSEIVEVTNRSGNTLTIIRGLEGTTAQAWPAGTPIENRFTAGYWDEVCRLISLTSAQTLVIANDTITMRQSFHFVDTEGGAPTDNLSTILGGSAGDLLFIRPVSSARSVVIKHGVGNIKTPSGLDVLLDSTDKLVALVYDGSSWLVLGSDLDRSIGITRVTGSYTLQMADSGRLVQVDSTTASTVTIPPDSSVPFRTGTRIAIQQYGTGSVTIQAGSGVTLRDPNAMASITTRYDLRVILKIGSNEWVII